MKKPTDLEIGVELVRQHGLSTGHADTWFQLLSEVLDQHNDCKKMLNRLKALEHDLNAARSGRL